MNEVNSTITITIAPDDTCQCERCPCCGKLIQKSAPIYIPTPFYVEPRPDSSGTPLPPWTITWTSS
jgi:hypothetical protein